MVFKLHIWGPGFGLPSIDAACLAAIVYLEQCLSDGDWSLVPSSNPDVSPYGELPALLDGTTWIAGFPGIVSHLQCRSLTRHPDANLTTKQSADLVAYTTFLLSKGQPLIDLLLYVSSENYNAATRPALGRVLDWPYSWTLPHTLRAQAKARSEHLRLSSLDVDAATEQARVKEEKKMTGQIPEILRRSRLTLGGALKDKQKTRFRLEGVIADLLEPLDDMLGKDKKWLLETEAPTSLDFLAIGYLTIMQSPDLPHPFIKLALHEKYSRLAKWAQDSTQLTHGLKDYSATLPWSPPPSRPYLGLISNAASATVSMLPIISSYVQVTEVPKLPSASDRQTRQNALVRLRVHRTYQTGLLFSGIISAMTTGWLWYLGYFTFTLSSRAPRVSRREFGAAGSLLGLR